MLDYWSCYPFSHLGCIGACAAVGLLELKIAAPLYLYMNSLSGTSHDASTTHLKLDGAIKYYLGSDNCL